MKKTWKDIQSPIYWENGKVIMLDQRLLPTQEVWNSYSNHSEIASAIKEMVIRGAPAIGCAAAMGVALGAQTLPTDRDLFSRGFSRVCDDLAATRPTAVNLFWAISRQKRVFEHSINEGVENTKEKLINEALKIWQEDIAACKEMGRIGAELVPDGAAVLTHCNAGALATGGYGTALGVIRGAVAAGKSIKVYADETRPFLQGARLTAWELQQDGIDVTLICDNQAGNLFRQNAITCCVVGADRIARNGDTANKIGTYAVAVLAHYHDVPFYVAAPRSTIDRELPNGEKIPIEQRSGKEITHIGPVQLAPNNIKVINAAFDVTPHTLIAALITEVGLARPPEEKTIAALFGMP
ncbi:MAG: S-methyl-5-thioribose-1-phosphate isomerase [Pseudomonadota bacterium]